jgi:hypothetical protein
MALVTISVPLFPNVPMLPGVPQLLRSALFPPSPFPTLGAGPQSNALGASANHAPAWGILDSDLNPVLTPDSILDFDQRAEYSVSNFPVQAGGFASYNKVTLPQELVLRMSKAGTGVGDRAQFLATLHTLSRSFDLYTIITPERSYANVNITRYEVSRRREAGAYFLTEVDVFFIEIRQVTAQYSTTSTAANTQNAQQAVSKPATNSGMVQPKAPWPAIPNQFGPKPFVLGTDPNAVFSTLGPSTQLVQPSALGL